MEEAMATAVLPQESSESEEEPVPPPVIVMAVFDLELTRMGTGALEFNTYLTPTKDQKIEGHFKNYPLS